jgi:hypothetical protein
MPLAAAEMRWYLALIGKAGTPLFAACFAFCKRRYYEKFTSDYVLSIIGFQ